MTESSTPSNPKFTVETKALRAALEAVVPVVHRQSTVPILNNLKVAAGKRGGLRITGTDMDIAVTAVCEAAVERAGETTIPAHKLRDIAGAVDDGAQIGCDADDKSLIRIRAGRANFALGTLPASDYPRMTDGAYPVEFELDGDTMRALVTVPANSISNEETRVYLNGIYMHATKAADSGLNVMRAVATDGHRLTRFQVPLPAGAENMAGVIVPRRTIMLLQALLRDHKGDVRLGWSDTRIRLAIGDVEMTSKLIDGAFPDYERVIPDGEHVALEMNVKEAQAALKRVALVSSEKTRIAAWHMAKGHVAFKVRSAEGGEADEEIDAAWNGGEMTVGLNTAYAQAVLGNLRGENVRWEFKDPASPTKIFDLADENVLYVIMPARV